MTLEVAGPVTFDEKEFIGITSRLPILYMQLSHDIYGLQDNDDDDDDDRHHQHNKSSPASHSTIHQNLHAFTSLLSISMFPLNDDHMCAVNYCRHTLDPLAAYCVLTTRLVRGLRDCWAGNRAAALRWGRVVENAKELEAALERVRAAWKRDLAEGAGGGAGAGAGSGTGIGDGDGDGGGSGAL